MIRVSNSLDTDQVQIVCKDYKLDDTSQNSRQKELINSCLNPDDFNMIPVKLSPIVFQQMTFKESYCSDQISKNGTLVSHLLAVVDSH